MATNVALPEGFVLDEPVKNENSLPDGFILDEPIKSVATSKPQSIATTQPVQEIQEESPVKLTGGVETKRIANWDKKGRIYYTDENGNKIEDGLNPFQRIGRKIQAGATNIGRSINNPTKDELKNRQKTAFFLETLPFGGGLGGLAGITAANTAFDNYVDNGKINPKQIAINTALAVGGGKLLEKGGQWVLNTPVGRKAVNKANETVGRIVKTYRGHKLKKSQKLDNMSKEQIKEFRNQARDYYNDYIKGSTISREDVGTINFGNAGIDEQLSKGLHNADVLPELTSQIEKGQYKGTRKDYPREDIKNFHIVENDFKNRNMEYQIAEDSMGNKYYFAKDISNKKELPPLAGTNIQGRTTPNNIIPQVGENVTPVVETKPSRLAQTADLPEELEGLVKSNPPEYEVLHNKDLIAQAENEIANNPNTLADLRYKAQGKDNLSALDFETARQTISQLYAEGRTAEAMELIDLVSKKGSAAGQAVQAMSLWQKTTPEGAALKARQIVEEYNKSASKNKQVKITPEIDAQIRQLAENIQKAPEGREKDVATALLMKRWAELIPPSKGQKLKTLRNISLLLNPKTFNRNITGNAIFAGMENAVTKPIAAGLDTIASKFTGQRTRVAPQLGAYAKGFGQGIKEGIEDVNLGINTRNMGGRFDLPSSQSFNPNQEFVPILDDSILGTVKNVGRNATILGNKIAAPFEKLTNYSLQVPDRAFYQAAFNESLANQMKAAKTLKATPEMLENATQEALEAVYQNNSKVSDFTLGLRRAANRLNYEGFGVGDVLVPYAQTPANVVQQGWNYSPFGLVNMVNSIRAGNQRQATLDAARAITGTGLGGLGFGLAANGLINNAGADDYQTQKNYEAMGIRPNTINIGDKNYSYSQLQPLSSPLSAGAGLYFAGNGDYIKAGDTVINNLLDMSMLRGLSDFAKDYNDEGLATASANVLLNTPSQFIPTGVNQINAFIDPYQRETYDPNKFKQAINKTINKTPIGRTLPLKRDLAGRPMKKYSSEGAKYAWDALANPIFENTPINDPVIQEGLRLQDVTGKKGSLLPVPEKTYNFYNPKTGKKERRKLTADEYSTYSEKLGQATYGTLNYIQSLPMYDELTAYEKADLNELAKKMAKSQVQENLFMTPEEKRQNLINDFLKKHPDERTKAVKEVKKMLKSDILPIKIQEFYKN